MNLHILGEICGFIAGTIGISQGIPQFLRIRNLGHSDGVALSPWILLCVSFSAWFGWGLKEASPAIYVTNLLTFTTSALVVIAIRGKALTSLALVLALGAAASNFVLFAPTFIVDPVLVALTASRLPQLIRTWMNRNRSRVTAVSIPTLLIALTSGCFWLLYAVFTENMFVVLTTLVAISINLATGALEFRIAARARAAA